MGNLELNNTKTVADLNDGDDYWYLDMFGNVEKGVWGLDYNKDASLQRVANVYTSEYNAILGFFELQNKSIMLEYGSNDCNTENMYYIKCEEGNMVIEKRESIESYISGVVYFETIYQAEKALDIIKGLERYRKTRLLNIAK